MGNDGDGIIDLGVGTWGDDDGGSNHGAIYILFLKSDLTVKSYQKISDTQGGFTGSFDDDERFGCNALTLLGDINGDGVPDIGVGAHGDDDGGLDRGAIYILYLTPQSPCSPGNSFIK